METRVEVPCDACGGKDVHPRHVVAMPDGSVQRMHMDCCRDANDCEHCDKILCESSELRGHKLISWIKENK